MIASCEREIEFDVSGMIGTRFMISNDGRAAVDVDHGTSDERVIDGEQVPLGEIPRTAEPSGRQIGRSAVKHGSARFLGHSGIGFGRAESGADHVHPDRRQFLRQELRDDLDPGIHRRLDESPGHGPVGEEARGQRDRAASPQMLCGFASDQNRADALALRGRRPVGRGSASPPNSWYGW